MKPRTKCIHFDTTDCGVPFFINSGQACTLGEYLTEGHTYTTDFFELYLFSQDAGYIYVDDVFIKLQPNMLLFLSPAHRRRWEIEVDSSFEYLLFGEEFLGTFLRDRFFVHRLQFCLQYIQNPLTLHLGYKDYNHIYNLFKEVQEDLRAIRLDSEQMLQSLLSYLLLYINRLYCQEYNLAQPGQGHPKVFEFKLLLDKHIREWHSVPPYLSYMGISRTRLDGLCRLYYGLSTSEMIKRRLLVEVRKELLYTDNSLKEIAYALGFSEPNHMMRFFKTMMGMTIGTYIESCKNGSKLDINGSEVSF